MARKTAQKPAEGQTKPQTAQWPVWLYKGSDARLFAEGEVLPPGWLDHPKG